MSSNLLKKLSTIAAPAAKPRPSRRGLLVRRYAVPAETALFTLDAARFRALGFEVQSASDCLFLDTETTGLARGAGTVAFLVGLGYLDGNEFVVEQYLMRDYPDEPDLLAAVVSTAKRFSAVVTFNGANFDLPLLDSRFTMNRMRGELPPLVSVDLLLPARRLWKLRIKSCRLANLEAQILGVPREHDLPGSEVPGRYFSFLKTGDESLLTDVLDHNREDVVSLGKLLAVLSEAYFQPEMISDPIDLFSAGRAFERRGEDHTARRLYVLASAPRPVTSLSALTAQKYAGEANARLYAMYRRAQDWENALAVLSCMLARRQKLAFAHVELAKYLEHRKRDYAEALRHVDAALALAPEAERAALTHRRERLIRKMR